MRRLSYYIFLLSLFSPLSPAYATDYHADATGGAANLAACGGVDPGGSSRCTLAQIEGASAGDVIYIYDDGGSISGTYRPDNNGSDGNPITIQAASGENPIIAGGANPAFNITSREYITIGGSSSDDRITWTTTSDNFVGYAGQSGGATNLWTGIIIQNNNFDGGGVYTAAVDYCQIIFNVFTNVDFAGIVVDGDDSYPTTQVRLEGNTLTGSFDDPSATDAITVHYGSQPYDTVGNYILVKNNVVTMLAGSGENCYDLTSGHYIYLVGNICSGSASLGAIASGTRYYTGNTMSWARMEDNLVYDLPGGNAEAFIIAGDDADYFQLVRNRYYTDAYGSWFLYNYQEPSWNSNLTHRIFHNTADVRNVTGGGGIRYYGGDPQDVIAKNNIIVFDNDYLAVNLLEPGAVDMDFDYNIYYNTDATPGDLWNETYKTLANIRTNYSQEANGIEDNPDFVNISTHDFNLTSGSPARNAGIGIVIITSATESTSTPTVDDPYALFDGWGIGAGTSWAVSGTVFKTQAGQMANITDVDYDTGIVTLDASISVVNGEWATDFDYSGSAPDIGAIEYTESATNPTVTSASVNGSSATINMSEDVVITGLDDGDFKMTGSATGQVNLNSCSEDTGVISCTAGATFVYGETVTLRYDGGADEVESADDAADLETFSGTNVSNNTAQVTGVITQKVQYNVDGSKGQYNVDGSSIGLE